MKDSAVVNYQSQAWGYFCLTRPSAIMFCHTFSVCSMLSADVVITFSRAMIFFPYCKAILQIVRTQDSSAKLATYTLLTFGLEITMSSTLFGMPVQAGVCDCNQKPKAKHYRQVCTPLATTQHHNFFLEAQADYDTRRCSMEGCSCGR